MHRVLKEPLPTQALDLALERAQEWLFKIAKTGRHHYFANLGCHCSDCKRLSELDVAVSALEQAQRVGKKYSAGGVRITDDCATVESITDV